MIGTWLAGTLRARGDDVRIVTRHTPSGPDQIQWDPVKGIVSLRPLEGLDAIFNLAGAPLATRPWTRHRRRVLLDSRVRATHALIGQLETLVRPPAVYVGVGQLGIYGDRGAVEVDDDASAGSGFLADLCVAWEDAHARSEALGARWSVLRMSVVLSPTGGAFPLMVQPFRYVGGWLGNGQQYTPWISIRDAVGAFVHLADRSECHGAFNGTVPNPPQNKAWLKALGRVMHRPVVTHAPRWALRGALGELAGSLLIASIRAVPRKLLQTGYRFVDADEEATFRWLLSELNARSGQPR
jgi:hypothetical protein